MDAGHLKVSQLNQNSAFLILINKNVRRLDISVNYRLLANTLKCRKQLFGDALDLVLRQGNVLAGFNFPEKAVKIAIVGVALHDVDEAMVVQHFELALD